jgi:aspartate dehydrogenase
MSYSIGLIGYGRIGADLAARARSDPDFDLEYVYVRSPKPELPDELQISDPGELAAKSVDAVVEAATPAALATIAEPALEAGDLFVLSGSAFADPETETNLRTLATESAHEMYLPHAALFGIDGLADAREELETVHIEATKAPAHLDFAYADTERPESLEEPTVLYDGPTRGLCQRFPRNFNSHAAMAMAGLGLDDTTSTLVADPAAETARHVTTATGEGFDLEAIRDSDIAGVTGDFTLVSTWGSIRRVLRADDGPQFI